jgi:Outer membrane protein beta-barrel domain
MHENKFEKQVREKMDQLGFDPTDAVWTRVDQEIKKEKKRRKPIFWFFLSGLIVAGGVSYMMMNHFTPGKKTRATPEFSMINNQDNLTEENNKKEKKRSDETNQKVRADAIGKIISAHSDSASFQSENPLLVTKRIKISAKNAKEKAEKTAVVENSTHRKPEDIVQPPIAMESADRNAISTDIPKAAPVSKEQMNKTVRADSVSGKGTAKIKNKETKKSPWSIGFTGSVGASNINQSLFQSPNPANLSYSATYPSYPAPGPSAFTNMPSATNAGFSFAVGVSVRRNLSKRIAGSIGLGYHYYSTRIHIGIPVDSALTVYTRFAQSTSVNSYYRNGGGKDYTNQYHFIELPVNLSFQLNKSRKTPVNWEAGVSLAWLLSSNALHFDPYTNVYFENDQLFNKIQWNALTAILIGFPVHDHSIQIGPQVQYGLSSLLKNSSSYPGHLVYFGLKCTFIP